jgi:hypothetical protein
VFRTSRHPEYVVPIDLGVKWDMGAPMPHLLQSEYKTFLVFFLSSLDPYWDGTYITVADPNTPEPIGVIEWHACVGALLGTPNDDGLKGHRLWDKGLSDIVYGAGEVHNSAWVAELERMRRVGYPGAVIGLELRPRHFILCFHDSTFECLASGYTVIRAMGSMHEVTLKYAALLWPSPGHTP